MKRKREKAAAVSANAGVMPERLAASAFKLFSRRGINAVGLDDIAADARVTKGCLYWHYDSKDALIKAACNYYYRAYHRRVNSGLAHIADPVKRLERTLETAVDVCFFDRRSRVFSAEIFSLAVQDEELRRSWRQFSDSLRELYVGLLRAANRLSATQAELAADLLLSTMQGLKHRAYYEPHLFAPSRRRAILAHLKRIARLAD